MRLIKFDHDFYDEVRHKTLKADVGYVVTQLFAGYYSSISDGYVRLEPFTLKKFLPDADWNGKKILVHRSVGGAGDLLFITPLLRAIKEKWPRCHLVLYCYQMYHWIFAANPHLDECIDFTLPLLPEAFDAFDAHIDLEDAIEYSPLAKTHVAVDVFAAAAGMEVVDKKPLYVPASSLVDKLARRFPKERKRVAIALQSGSILRDYPLDLFMEVIRELLRHSIEVVLLGGRQRAVNGAHPLLLDLAKTTPLLSWEENVAFLKTCDLVVGPDSSSIHFAGAMGVPSLGLYAAFPAALRIATQPMTQAIQAVGACAPCYAQDRGGIHFPPNGPCVASRRCEVLATIPSEQIVMKILEMLRVSSLQKAEPAESKPLKKTCMICQPVGIGDILFVQKIAYHFAELGFRVVMPLVDGFAWIRHYLVPHPDIEYPEISTAGGGLAGDFKFADAFIALSDVAGPNRDPEKYNFTGPLAFNKADEETGFVFLAIGSSYVWLNDGRIMAAKYNFAGVDFSDWTRYVHLKRRPDVERELYYNVLGLKDGERYTLVNEACSSHSISLSVPGNIVKMYKAEGYTVIDWMLVIERAAQIVTIDTSLVILAEILQQQKPLYMISRYTPPTFEPIRDILTLDWKLVPTPEELDVSPVI